MNDDQDNRDLAIYGPCPMCGKPRRPHYDPDPDSPSGLMVTLRCDTDHSDGRISPEAMRYW